MISGWEVHQGYKDKKSTFLTVRVISTEAPLQGQVCLVQCRACLTFPGELHIHQLIYTFQCQAGMLPQVLQCIDTTRDQGSAAWFLLALMVFLLQLLSLAGPHGRDSLHSVLLCTVQA